MREIRTSGLAGGEAEINQPSLPRSKGCLEGGFVWI
jgi:hypothetical protein